MTPEHWRFINNLLQEALDRSPAERNAFLDEVCADESSRKEVQSLLSFDEEAQDFLEVPAIVVAAELFAGNERGSMAGKVIGGYQVESLLGVGGMGEVYLAVDPKLDRKVAIKSLPGDLETDDLARKRLIREAKAAAKLDHPNICAIYEIAQEANRSFIVMQYVEGEALANRIQRGPMPVRESLNIIIQVADALCLAHSRGIVHRDITPHNIMITPSGQVKVLDFGLAKVLRLDALDPDVQGHDTSLSVSGVIVGTVPYMSPEQAKGATVDARSDLFSVGVVLYECVAGKRAFVGGSLMEICAQIIHDDPPPLSLLSPNIPVELDRVVFRALAKEPDLRYQSIGELLEELRPMRDALSNEGITSK